MSVLVVSGLKREAAILSGPGRLAICGDGPTLRSSLADLENTRFDIVISWGVCGGLDPRLRPGDLIIGSGVVSSEEHIGADEAVASSLARRLTDAGTRVSIERVAAVSSPVLTARAKADLHLAVGAAAVDMESLIAGRFARERRTPFAILRAVADPAERDLPPLLLDAVDSNGRIRAGALFAKLARSSGQLAKFVAAARDGQAAFRTLGRCRGLLPGLFLGLGPADL